MAAKQLQFDIAAREALLQGVDKLANTVKVTLPPRSIRRQTAPRRVSASVPPGRCASAVPRPRV